MIGAVTNHLWQSTLFVIVVGALTVAFRKNRATVRYWLWFSASVKFFAPFALLMTLGSRLSWASFVSQISTLAISLTIEQIAQPFTGMQTATASMRAVRSDWTFLIVLSLWLIGFAAITLKRHRAWRRIRGIVRMSSPLNILEVSIPSPVRVRSYPGLLEPGVVGWLRPVLLLPSDIMERLTPRQLHAVLAHELCHVRRRDNLTSAIHMIVEAVFWFHPLVWWVGARLIDERERACDEDVLRLGNEPDVYSEGILNVCKIYLASPLRCVSGVTGSDLKKRIHSILSGGVVVNLSFAKKAALAAAGLTAILAPVVAGMMIHAVPLQAQSQAPSAEVSEAARDALNKGVRTFRNSNYDEAIQFFEEAVRLDPSLINGQLYLATAYAQRYMAGTAPEQDKKYAALAIETFSKVVQRDSSNVAAIAGLAAVYQKDNQWRKARELYLRNTELDPQNPVPQFGVGATDLAIVADQSSYLSTAEKSRLIDEGLQYLNQALTLKPEYYQAMSTLSILYREKAAIVNTKEEKSRLEVEAASWLAKSRVADRSSPAR